MADITEEEAEQYDRQIRLWGLESQKRLRGSSVLVIGLKGFGAEICKNIILAGVKSITLMDHKNISNNDTYSQFLAPQELVGENRAKSSIERAQILNPNVEVKYNTQNAKNQPDDFFISFDAIIASDCNRKLLLRLDRLCRASSIKFFCGDVYGCYGYMFTDLHHHVYAEEKTKWKKGEKEKVEEKITVKGSIEFCPLIDALNVNWSSKKYQNMLKRMDSTYFLILVLMDFRTKARRNPSPLHEIEDIKLLEELREKIHKRYKLPTHAEIKDEELRMVFSQLSPVCAVLGGVLAQEVIKALSQHGEPHNNFFLFNPNNISGRVIQLGAS